MTRITEIEHPSHPGHLLKHEPPAEPFKCNACKELGFGSRYACEHQRCNYHLHEECASSEHNTSHPLFPGCEFTLLHESQNRVCDVCGVDIRGISYQCSCRKARDSHPCCLSLPPSIITADGGVHLRLSDSVSSKCGRCGRKEAAKKVKGWFYSSSHGEYCFHVACVKEMILKKYKTGYFNKDKGYDRLSLPPVIKESARSSSNALARTSNSSVIGRKGKMVLLVVNMVLKLIVSAIFGNPTAGVAILIESLFK